MRKKYSFIGVLLKHGIRTYAYETEFRKIHGIFTKKMKIYDGIRNFQRDTEKIYGITE